MARRLIIDPEQLELDSPLVSLDEIRRVNPQRNEMEQLTAIVYIDPKQHVIAGYKDVGLDEHGLPSGHHRCAVQEECDGTATGACSGKSWPWSELTSRVGKK